jgi:hypothetical protein
VSFCRVEEESVAAHELWRRGGDISG